MAVKNIASYNKARDGMALPLSITRGNPNPLDDTYLYATLADAQAYAKNGVTAYVGQIITVLNTDVTDGEPHAYIITDEDGTLSDITGGIVGVDGTTIVNQNGILSAVGQVNADGTTIKNTNGTFSVIQPDMMILSCGGAMAKNEIINVKIMYGEDQLNTVDMGWTDTYQIIFPDGSSPTLYTYSSDNEFVIVNENGLVSIDSKDVAPTMYDATITILEKAGS